MVLVRELTPFLKGIDIHCIILECISSKLSRERDRVVNTFLIADESASIELVLWEPVSFNTRHFVSFLRPGDIIHITEG
jgi:hypothetical protein